jgi:hypothetical protein
VTDRKNAVEPGTAKQKLNYVEIHIASTRVNSNPDGEGNSASEGVADAAAGKRRQLTLY